MTAKIYSITNPKIKLEVLTNDEVLRIHAATLDVLKNVGVRFPSKRALAILEAQGAHIDWEKCIARIPSQLVEDALAKAPPVYSLAARHPDQDLQLDGNHVYLGTDGCGVEVLDLDSGELRRSSLRDVAEIARIADCLPEIAFHWVAVSAQDCPKESRSLHELKAIWENSTKHVQTESIYCETEAAAAIEMAALLMGGREELRKRPILSMMQCTASPLGQDGGSLDAALVAAEAGVPVGFMTMAACLTTAPATLAGALVVGNAEVLGALTLIESAYPGSPFFYAAAQTSSDLRTGSYTGGGPEDFLFGAATNHLADYYNLPLSMGSFATGSKQPDWQAGIDNSLSTLMASAVMSDMLLGAGLLDGSRIWSYEQMLMDCEIYRLVGKLVAGIPVDEEALALDTIQVVGPGGNFLGQKHTLQHMRERWVPKLFDRRPYEVWLEKGDGPRDWARSRAQEILATHEPEPLDKRLSQELSRIIAIREHDD
jgi:trimethylamine--corrinoid protein Co-methyltransferase